MTGHGLAFEVLMCDVGPVRVTEWLSCLCMIVYADWIRLYLIWFIGVCAHQTLEAFAQPPASPSGMVY